MKAIHLVLLVVLLNVSATHAQEKQSNGVPVKQTDVPEAVAQKKELKLTYEQQSPYREIIKRYAELVREVRKSALKPEEKKAKIELLGQQREAEIKALLTPEQYKTHLELVELRKAQMVDMRKKAPAGPVNNK